MNNILWKPLILDGNLTVYKISTDGTILNSKTNNIVKPYLAISNKTKLPSYYKIKLHFRIDLKTRMRKSYYIHRLVAQTFIPNPENKPQVNHKDGNKLNNHIDNLEWVTQSENMIHASITGLLHPKYGSENQFSVHNEAQIHKVCKLLEKASYTIKEISAETGVNKITIYNIWKNRKWKQISCNYNIKSPLIRGTRWDSNTRKKLNKLLKSGVYDFKKICKELSVPADITSKSFIYKRIRNSKTSTTIENAEKQK